MYDWAKFFEEYPERFGEEELLKQVGKTVGGIPITEEQFRVLIESVREHLEIKGGDRVLDLCCGNGLITKELAKECTFVMGMDFSAPLIEVAKKYNSCENVEYMHMDVRRIEELLSPYSKYFNKVLCYEALAFFDMRSFDEMLKNILLLSTEDPVIVFGSVLDRERLWDFFNTFRRKILYLVQIRVLGREVGLGRWWKRREIEKICKKHNLQSEIFYQCDILHTSHYRFDVKISRRPANKIV